MDNENKISPKAIPIDEPTFQEYLAGGYDVYAGDPVGGTAIFNPNEPQRFLYFRNHPGFESRETEWLITFTPFLKEREKRIEAQKEAIDRRKKLKSK